MFDKHIITATVTAIVLASGYLIAGLALAGYMAIRRRRYGYFLSSLEKKGKRKRFLVSFVWDVIRLPALFAVGLAAISRE